MGKLQGNATQSPSRWQPHSAPSVERGRWGSQPGPLRPASHGLCPERAPAWAAYLAPSTSTSSPSPGTCGAPQRGRGFPQGTASCWKGPECGLPAGEGLGGPSQVCTGQAPVSAIWDPRVLDVPRRLRGRIVPGHGRGVASMATG